MRGEIHHDRRLHKLMLREEQTQWERGLHRSSTAEEEELQQQLAAAAAAAAGPAQHGGEAGPASRPASRESVGSVASSATSPADSALSMHGEAAGKVRVLFGRGRR